MAEKIAFQARALEKLSSPDELDHLLKVVNLRSWLLLTVLSLFVAMAVLWGAVGRIPVTVTGGGVLVSPGNVRGLQSQASGQLVDLPIRVGQTVAQRDIIGVLNQAPLKQQLEQAERKLREEVDHDRESTVLETRRRELERLASATQIQFYTDEIARLRMLSSDLKNKNKSYNETQRENLVRSKAISEKLHTSLSKVRDEIRTLRTEGLASGQTLLQSERELNESLLRLANLDVELRELDLREIQGQENALQMENRISDLSLQLKKLEIQEQRADHDLRETRLQREMHIADQRRLVERLQLELTNQSEIKAQWSGRILELAVAPGQLVQPGERLGTIEVDEPDSELKCLLYLPVKDGKRITEGMKVHVTPSTVQRERDGAIVGRVSKCSKFPITRQGAINMVGNPDIAASLTQAGGMIEVEVSLERDADSFSGYRWTSRGPQLRFSAGTTTSARITVEQRAPITYVIPSLRTWFLGAADDASVSP